MFFQSVFKCVWEINEHQNTSLISARSLMQLRHNLFLFNNLKTHTHAYKHSLGWNAFVNLHLYPQPIGVDQLWWVSWWPLTVDRRLCYIQSTVTIGMQNTGHLMFFCYTRNWYPAFSWAINSPGYEHLPPACEVDKLHEQENQATWSYYTPDRGPHKSLFVYERMKTQLNEIIKTQILPCRK